MAAPTNMTYAPQFKNGTVFEPGTVTHDGSGNITGGTPFPNNTVPQSMWQPLSAQPAEDLHGNPRLLRALRGRVQTRAMSGYFYNNPDDLVKNQDLLRVDYAISSKMNSFFRWVNDYQKETIQNGIWTGEPFPIQPQMRPKPGSSWAWNLVTRSRQRWHRRPFFPITTSRNRCRLPANESVQPRYRWAPTGPNSIRKPTLRTQFQDVTTNAGVNFSLGDPGLAQYWQGLRRNRKRFLGQGQAHVQVRLFLQPATSKRKPAIGDWKATSISARCSNALQYRQRSGEPDVRQFQHL